MDPNPPRDAAAAGQLPTPDEILGLYPGLSGWQRLLLRTRFVALPCAYLHGHIPPDAQVFELGCGQGVLANYLKQAAPGREVTGLDLSAERIRIAQSSVRGRPGLSFHAGDITRCELPAAAAGKRPRVLITAQVLYLLAPDAAQQVLAWIRRQLGPDDSYWIVDYQRQPALKYLFLRAENAALTLAVRAAHRGARARATAAFGERTRLARIPSRTAWAHLLAGAGLAAERVDPGNRTPYPQIVWRCRAPRPGAGA